MRGRYKGTLGLLAISLCSCAVSPANPLVDGFAINPDPKGEERILRGVVNGLWKYDPETIGQKMAKYDEHLTPEEISEYSTRYIVRVGVNRAPPVEFISPVVLGKWVEFVVLPAGWTHDLHTISSDPTVVNVGDVVDVRAQKGRYFDFLDTIVRQCGDTATAGENKDWDIGCKTYKDFDNRDFAGDYHFLRSF
jgi:hypothetical protein